MNIAKILEYQKLDLVIYKADRDYVNSAENKKYQAIRASIIEITESLIKLDKEAADIFADIERLKTLLETFVKKSKATPLSGAKTLEQADKLEDTINGLDDELNGLDKEMQKAFKRLNEISKEAKDLSSKYAALKIELKKVEELRKQKRSEIINSINKEGNLLNEMKDSMDPKYLAIYSRARAAKVKMPIVVEYKDGHCAACGMEIKSEVENKLQNPEDIAECPNCRRILYKK